MKIVYAGGTGFIGSKVVPALVKEGYSVVLLSRSGGGAAHRSEASGVRTVRWNGRDRGAWEEELEGAGAVLNFAGESIGGRRWTDRQKALIMGSRVEGTRALVSAAERAAARPGILISASGVGYYGDTGDREVTELSPAGSDFLASVCKRWEEEARRAEALGLRTVVLRIGLVLGDNGGALPRMMLPFRLFAGGPLGSGRQWFPWIHWSDLVSTVLAALKTGSLRGPVNAVAPELVTNAHFSARLGEAMGRPSWFSVPAPALRLALGEMSEMLLTGQRALPSRLQHAGFSYRYPSLYPALVDIFRQGG